MRANGAEHHGVAIGRGIRHALGTGHAAGAPNIFNDHLLTKNIGHAGRHDPPEHIGGASSCNGITIVIARLGKFCAAAPVANAINAVNAAAKNDFV